MQNQRPNTSPAIAFFLIPPLIFLLVGLACTRGMPAEVFPTDPTGQAMARTVSALLTPISGGNSTLSEPNAPRISPTPDLPHALPTVRTEIETYVVKPGDSLAQIAQRYKVTVDAIITFNQISNPNYLEVGQQLRIPQPETGTAGLNFKIIPDSELVYGPAATAFNLEAYVRSQGGYLASYQETLEDGAVSGIAIVQRVAEEYSVNPRLLLAILEYRAGWVGAGSYERIASGRAVRRDFPLIQLEAWRKGLYRQLAWAANRLNYGYYRWRENQISHWLLADGQSVPASPLINAGTAGVQNLFAAMYGRAEWERSVSESGLQATFQNMFGYPFALAVEPLILPNLQQPALTLPFEPGLRWAFTGGPHGGWADGSAWAALDFAPPGEPMGCVRSDAWVTAVAGGTIVRTGNGVVIQDLDISSPRSNDGREQTGWVILYMHIDSYERVQPGTYVRAGERIGHPSCEGGVSNGTHVHIARRYNGEWVPAASDLPFVMDGWVPISSGSEYNGFLQKGDQLIEAWDGPREESTIGR